MKVECPNCQTKYNLPDDKVGPQGANVRCSVCRHEFHVHLPEADDFPGFGESGASPIWPVQGEGEDALDFGSQLDEARKKDPFDDAGVSSSDFASIDFGQPAKNEGEKSGKTKKIILAAGLGFALLMGVAGAAAYFFEFWPFAKPHADVQAPQATQNPQAPGASAPGGQSASVMENAPPGAGQPKKRRRAGLLCPAPVRVLHQPCGGQREAGQGAGD